jgi:hypothetical protein
MVEVCKFLFYKTKDSFENILSNNELRSDWALKINANSSSECLCFTMGKLLDIFGEPNGKNIFGGKSYDLVCERNMGMFYVRISECRGSLQFSFDYDTLIAGGDKSKLGATGFLEGSVTALSGLINHHKTCCDYLYPFGRVATFYGIRNGELVYGEGNPNLPPK